MNSRYSTFLVRLACLMLLIMATSCNEDESAPSKRPLLVGKAWAAVRYEMNGEDITDEWEECDLDNTTVFFDDGTFIDVVGDLTCDEFEADVEGTWQFKANETILSFKPAGESASDWKLLELTDNTLKISQYVPWFLADITVVMEPTTN